MMCKFEHDGDCCNCGSPQYMCKCKPKLCGSLVPMTNADRLRAMSDEELASEMSHPAILTICDIVCQGECNAMATLDKTSGEVCKEIILNWLRQPAEEDA